jgi:adenine-specific DNA methylase
MTTKTREIVVKQILADWKINTSSFEWSLHQLSPYLGKIKSSVANSLIQHFSKSGDVIYDPFCGAGTIPLEAWVAHRSVIANDLNAYAFVLVQAKLNPPSQLDKVLDQVVNYENEVKKIKNLIDLRKQPKWVRSFFHKETLREIIAWVEILKRDKEYFLLSCLLGILHHQRPGFLSFPASHSVPYLRLKKYPRSKYPQLYQYRPVAERLIKKIKRAFCRKPVLNYSIQRKCFQKNASQFIPNIPVDLIITSPPYMRQLDYGRDNRLRLHFLGVENYKALDILVSPTEKDFVKTIKRCLITWKKVLKDNGKCILVIGDGFSKSYQMKLPEMIRNIAVVELKSYDFELQFQSVIPEKRRVRKGFQGSKRETVLVLKKRADGKVQL